MTFMNALGFWRKFSDEENFQMRAFKNQHHFSNRTSARVPSLKLLLYGLNERIRDFVRPYHRFFFLNLKKTILESNLFKIIKRSSKVCQLCALLLRKMFHKRSWCNHLFVFLTFSSATRERCYKNFFDGSHTRPKLWKVFSVRGSVYQKS